MPKRKPQSNWSSFTKAELIRTIKTLNGRQTKLLNRIAVLERMFKDLPPVEVRRDSAMAKIVREGETAADIVRVTQAEKFLPKINWPWEEGNAPYTRREKKQ